jgi:hypothetical protein
VQRSARLFYRKVTSPEIGRRLRRPNLGRHTKRRRALSANGDGTLTIISEGDGDRYAVQRTIPTFFGGRNMAIDPEAGTLFIAHGNMKLMSGTKDLTQLRFGWDGLDLAIFEPLD